MHENIAKDLPAITSDLKSLQGRANPNRHKFDVSKNVHLANGIVHRTEFSLKCQSDIKMKDPKIKYRDWRDFSLISEECIWHCSCLIIRNMAH